MSLFQELKDILTSFKCIVLFAVMAKRKHLNVVGFI